MATTAPSNVHLLAARDLISMLATSPWADVRVDADKGEGFLHSHSMRLNEPQRVIHIYSDASVGYSEDSENVRRPHSAGTGWLALNGDYEFLAMGANAYMVSESETPFSSNTAEARGIIDALTTLGAWKSVRTAPRVIVHCDNMSVVTYCEMVKTHMVTQNRLSFELDSNQVDTLLKRSMKGYIHLPSFDHIKGHVRNEPNNVVDHLSKLAREVNEAQGTLTSLQAVTQTCLMQLGASRPAEFLCLF